MLEVILLCSPDTNNLSDSHKYFEYGYVLR
jgi:hypothetical protein